MYVGVAAGPKGSVICRCVIGKSCHCIRPCFSRKYFPLPSPHSCFMNTFFTRRSLRRFLAHLSAENILLLFPLSPSIEDGVELPATAREEEKSKEKCDPRNPPEQGGGFRGSCMTRFFYDGGRFFLYAFFYLLFLLWRRRFLYEECFLCGLHFRGG